jgi:hypothetical protein
MINGNAHSLPGGQDLLSRLVSLSWSVIGSGGLAVGYSAQIADYGVAATGRSSSVPARQSTQLWRCYRMIAGAVRALLGSEIKLEVESGVLHPQPLSPACSGAGARPGHA